MISGKKKVSLTQETIFKRITEYDIFRFYMPSKGWKVNEATHSPFREDKNPSFMISNRYGSLTFIDFGDTRFRGDCLTFVKTLLQLKNMDETLKTIDRDFGLGISNKEFKSDYKLITSKYEQPESKGKRYSKIQVIPRPFTKEELAYWNMYHQDISDLKRENVYSIQKVFLNKRLFSLNENVLRFGYFYDGYWKIYRPFESKKRKWIPNNVPITTLDGKDAIKDCEIAFINKSKKDYMVTKKLLPSSAAVQNEGIACFSNENVDYIKSNSKRQVLSFDSDIPGVKNSLMVTEMFGFDYANVPKKYLKEGIKDWADLAKVYGMDRVEHYFKENKLI